MTKKTYVILGVVLVSIAATATAFGIFSTLGEVHLLKLENVTPPSISEDEAFSKLMTVFSIYQKNTTVECPASENCPALVISSEERVAIAHAYGLTSSANVDNVHIALQKGKSLDINSLGSSYVFNKQNLLIDDAGWYWELGACDTNNQIFINATNGVTAGIHRYTYCTKVDELAAPQYIY